MLLPFQGATAPTRDTQGVACPGLRAPLGLQPALAHTLLLQLVTRLCIGSNIASQPRA